MLFTILSATTSRNSAHTAWERIGKSSSETSLQMSSSLTETIHSSRKRLLMFSSPWCQAGLSVQLAAVISCPLPAGCLLLWSHCCEMPGAGFPAMQRPSCHQQAQLPQPIRHRCSTQAFFTWKAVQMTFPRPRKNLCFCSLSISLALRPQAHEHRARVGSHGLSRSQTVPRCGTVPSLPPLWWLGVPRPVPAVLFLPQCRIPAGGSRLPRPRGSSPAP